AYGNAAPPARLEIDRVVADAHAHDDTAARRRLQLGLAEIHPRHDDGVALRPARRRNGVRRAQLPDRDLHALAGDGALDIWLAIERGVGIEQSDHGRVLMSRRGSHTVDSKRRSGRRRSARSAPISSKTIEPTKGSAQLPVASIRTP